MWIPGGSRCAGRRFGPSGRRGSGRPPGLGAAGRDLPSRRGGVGPIAVLLDRVTDPHNVGAILRSAEVFGARAVIAPRRHAAPETGALAKAASGALERQPYVRVTNLANAMTQLSGLGYLLVGLDGAAEQTLPEAARACGGQPIALVFGAEGPGMRQRTASLCDMLVRIDPAGEFGSLKRLECGCCHTLCRFA